MINLQFDDECIILNIEDEKQEKQYALMYWMLLRNAGNKQMNMKHMILNMLMLLCTGIMLLSVLL